jgi:hypothetical protein
MTAGLYYVKRDLFGLPAGRVERFAGCKAAPLLVDGAIEPFDPQKHGRAPGAPPEHARPVPPSKR